MTAELTPAAVIPTQESSAMNAERSDEGSQLWQWYSQTGHGSGAEDQLVENYLSLVHSVVSRIASTLPPQVEVRDLLTAGRVGLLNAIRRFNLRSDASFAAHARLRICGGVLDELRRRDWMPTPPNAITRTIRDVMERHASEKGLVPNESAIADAMKLSVEGYRELLGEPGLSSNDDSEAAGSSIAPGLLPVPPVEMPPAASVDSTPAEPTEPPYAGLIAEHLEKLPGIQRQVLALHYCEDLRLQEIAKVLGLPKERVCEIHAQAIRGMSRLVEAARETSAHADLQEPVTSGSFGRGWGPQDPQGEASGCTPPFNAADRPVAWLRQVGGELAHL